MGRVGVAVILTHPVPKYPPQDLYSHLVCCPNFPFSCAKAPFSWMINGGDDPLLWRTMLSATLSSKEFYTGYAYTHAEAGRGGVLPSL